MMMKLTISTAETIEGGGGGASGRGPNIRGLRLEGEGRLGDLTCNEAHSGSVERGQKVEGPGGEGGGNMKGQARDVWLV
jgi:hypothetical protein